jgi:transcriptional regulator with XRE-family HTH domain
MSNVPENGANSVALSGFLRRARGDAGLSQREVERTTGISNAYLSQLESGKVREPSPRILHKLAEAYGISYSDLLIAAGFPLPEFGKKRRPASRSPNPLGPITDKEQAALKEYLEFLRSKERKRR